MFARNSNPQNLSLVLVFNFPPDYPNSAPKFEIDNLSNLGKNHIARLLADIQSLAKDNLGQEMIYDVANLVMDFLSDSVDLLGSVHDARKSNIEMQMEAERKSIQKKQSEMRKKAELAQGRLAEKVGTELERKQQLMVTSKFQKSGLSSAILPDVGADWQPILKNAIICPVSNGNFPKTHICWFADNPANLYSVEKYYLDSNPADKLVVDEVAEQLMKLKSYRYPEAATIYDYQITHDLDTTEISILTAFERNCSLEDVLKVSRLKSIKEASIICSTVLSLLINIRKNDIRHASTEINRIE